MGGDNSRVLRAILVGALIAGVADLVYACIHIASYYDMTPQQVFQSIARGVLGPATTEGGWGSASLGIALEFVLTFIMAAIYIVPSTRITDLRTYWWLLGPSYGVVVMVVMYVVVLPLSAVHGTGKLPDGPAPAPGEMIDHQMLYGTIFAHTILVGLPIAAAARFFLGRGPKAEAAVLA